VVDHVNNAAIWQAAAEIVEGPVQEAVFIFHGPVLVSDLVTLVSAPGQLWLLVEGDVRVSGEITLAR
jgi:hypothetical protein